MNIAVFVSGSGTNLQALLDAEKSGIIKSGRITLVVSSKKGVYAIERAIAAEKNTAVVARKDFAGGDEHTDALFQILDMHSIDLIVLAGYMSILTPRFIEKYRDCIINVHPALIPSFCGKGFYGLHVHKAVLNYGVKLSGATVHFVNEIPDGGAIISQKCVDVMHDDTPESLQKRIMEQAEWKLLPEAVELFCSGRLEISGRKVIIKDK